MSAQVLLHIVLMLRNVSGPETGSGARLQGNGSTFPSATAAGSWQRSAAAAPSNPCRFSPQQYARPSLSPQVTFIRVLTALQVRFPLTWSGRVAQG
ncbi:MAG: hypothetical protein M3434_03580 [Gemmatimonadota bacterium]|nr:hypothetical protein [Gemmatimonadota bacterium]